MAGGLGSRFWPVSRNEKPKQFLDILGTGKSFIQHTFERFAKVLPTENILVVTSRNYEALVREQLPQLKEEHLLLEPFRRNTAPCMAYATYKLFKENPDASVVVSPSDHYVANDDVFAETISNALAYADKNDVLITLGIKPNRPETHYGYIQANKSSQISINGNVAYNVKTFTEKPDEKLAKVFVDSGEFLWNSGMFIWNLRTIMKEMEAHQKGISILFGEGIEVYNTPGEQEFVKGVYEECKSISIDYGIMENTDKAVVYPVSFGWSDIGTWDALYGYKNKDEDGNLLSCNESLLRDVKNSVIISEGDKKVVVASGLENYMVINTKDVLLICPRDESIYKTLFAELPLNGLGKYQ
jgi:mannose-1-phosphate guanylyltransferase